MPDPTSVQDRTQPAPQASKPRAYTPLSDEERARRRQAINDQIRGIASEQVMDLFGYGGRGVHGGPGWTKYGLPDGTHLSVAHADGRFKVLERVPCPVLTDRSGAPKDGGRGAINLAILLMWQEGTAPATPKEAERAAMQKLQATFLPQTLGEGYRPAVATALRKVAPVAPPPPPKRHDLPAYSREYEEHVFRYLTQTRKLPAELVKHVFDSRVCYPAKQEIFTKGADGSEKFTYARPVLVSPIIDVPGGYPVAFEHKVIPSDLKRKTDGITSGPKETGVMMVGTLGSQTKRVVWTEAPIDALSKWWLDMPPADTCVVGTIGARSVRTLLEFCAKQKAEVDIALDADRAGMTTGMAIARECRNRGISYRLDYPPRAETRLRLVDDATGVERSEDLRRYCEREKIPFAAEPRKDGEPHTLLVGSVPAVWTKLMEYWDEENLRSSDPTLTAQQRSALRDAPKRLVDEKAGNNDWNDILRGNYVPKLDWSIAPPPGPIPQPQASSTPAPPAHDI